MRSLVSCAFVLAACGESGPASLVPDPAVETGCAPGPVPAKTTRAKPIACAEELIGGRLAGGRIGDFLLENEHVRVIVRGAGEGFYLHGSSGGGIVDAARVGGEDLVKEIQPAVDFAVGAYDELVITEAGDDGPAELVVRGPASSLDLLAAALGRQPPPLIIEHRYRLAASATVVELETRVYPQPGAELEGPTLYDAMFFGGRVHSFLPGRGFATGTGGAEVIAADGTTSSYGLVYPTGAPNPQLVDLAGIRLVSGPTLDNAPQRRWLVIGDGSVASVTEAAWRLRGKALGNVAGTTAAGIDIVVLDGGGAPLTVARSDATGAFAIALPAGDYTLRGEVVGREPGPELAVTVVADRTASADVLPGRSGQLTISVRDDDSSVPLPARIVIEQGGEQRIVWTVATGDATIAVPPGTVRVSVSRGLEYGAYVADAVAVADAQTVPLAVRLPRVLDTAGWISLDTHLHSELSTDSTFPLDDRLRSIAGEGVEVPVSSDHDFITDYTPVIAELGLSAWVGTLVGEEASSLVWGHINAWPLGVDANRAGAGAPRWLDSAPSDIFAALRGGDARRIVQVNHPRFGTSSLFDAIDLDPTTMTARRDPTALGLPAGTDLSDLGFDAIEVANGIGDQDFDQVFADWLALVAAGHRAAATGSSDSHGAARFAGEARTYVWVGVGADNPATVDPTAICDAIRARHVVVATGAFVTAGVVTQNAVSLPGDEVDVTGMAQVRLHVRVQAPPWQSVDAIKIYEGTRVIQTITLDRADTAPIRYDADVIVPTPATSTFWVVRVDPAGAGDPVLGVPMPAFTNPVFARVL